MKQIKVFVPHTIVISSATGVVGTTPSGGPCIVDVLDDGLSLFASQAEMINIADATTSDQSAVKNSIVVGGSIMQIEVEVSSGAADLTVTLNAFVDPKTPPV